MISPGWAGSGLGYPPLQGDQGNCRVTETGPGIPIRRKDPLQDSLTFLSRPVSLHSDLKPTCAAIFMVSVFLSQFSFSHLLVCVLFDINTMEL